MAIFRFCIPCISFLKALSFTIPKVRKLNKVLCSDSLHGGTDLLTSLPGLQEEAAVDTETPFKEDQVIPLSTGQVMMHCVKPASEHLRL